MQIDTSNEFLVRTNPASGAIAFNVGVGERESRTVIVKKERALVFAAWIAALADPAGEEFKKVHEAILNT